MINQWKCDDVELFGNESPQVRIPSKKRYENRETESWGRDNPIRKSLISLVQPFSSLIFNSFCSEKWNCEYIDLYDGCPWGEATTIDLSLVALHTGVDRKDLYTIPDWLSYLNITSGQMRFHPFIAWRKPRFSVCEYTDLYDDCP
jgi:hypothetical protein